MATRKDRRHSGYITPNSMVPAKELIKNDIFINRAYDEWKNYRDGMRDSYRDFKKIRKIVHMITKISEKRCRMNKKQVKLLKIRKARKEARK